MEGEAQVSQESTPTVAPEAPQTEATETVQTNETHTETPDNKPEGFERVEFTNEQLARVNRIYGNMKRYENELRDTRTDNQRLIDMVNHLATGQQQIVSHLQTTDFTEAESKLKSARDTAWGKGDVNAFNEANDQLIEIKAKKIAFDTQPKKQSEARQQQPSTDGQAMLNRARSYGELNGSEETAVQAWMGETDASGNLKRPWTSTGDARNYAAALEAQAVLNSPLYATKPLVEKLKEIDRRMGLQTTQPQTNVLSGGNLTRGKPNSNIKLDPKIEDVAVRLKFAGKDPKLTAQDHISAWKKAVEKSQAKGSKR